MNIVLDARWIFKERSGIGIHTRELAAALARLAPMHHFTLLFQDQALLERTRGEAGLAAFPNVECVVFPCGIFSAKSQLLLPGLLRRLKADVFHSTNYMIPLRPFPRGRLGRIACVVTLHDLIPLVLPDHAPRSKKARLMPVFKALMREVVRRADAILTVSESSRRDVIQHLGANPSLVHCTYNGVSPRFSPPSGDAGERAPLVLYVGRLDPYKNVPALVEAFARVREQLPPKARLRIVAPEDPRYPEARQAVQRLQLGTHVDWVTNASGDALVEEYRRAAVLVLASKYEGFGLPVVEAMACGTPVICSTTSSLPEVAGTAGWLVRPGDPRALSDALVQVVGSPDLRRGMSAAGIAQARHFSWDRCAQDTLIVYEKFRKG